MNWIKKLELVYKKYQRTILYIDLLFILVVFYLNSYFNGIWSQLLPAAVAGAFAILIEILFSMNDGLQKNIDAEEYKTINKIMTKIIEIIYLENKKINEIVIIGSSGGTSINVLVQHIMDTAKMPFEITLVIADPNSKQAKYFPEHWATESRATIERISSINKTKPENLTIKCYTYDYFPCVSGILINNNHLFLSTYTWSTPDHLSARLHSHFYYYRSSLTETYFQIFETWLNYAPKKEIAPSPNSTLEHTSSPTPR